MNNTNKRTQIWLVYLLLIALISVSSLYLANAAPEGVAVVWVANDSGPTRTPSGRQDPGGKIITVTMNLDQQDTDWKAYVGNVTGLLVLQSSSNKSIYEWPITTLTGEVYVSRNGSVNFSSGAISCADAAEIVVEQSVVGMVVTDTDKINSTFNSTNHTSFNVGSNAIGVNSCSATALWVNDTLQSPSPSAIFQEVVLHDGSTLVYASLINDNKVGFDNTTSYDFQAIVAENRTSSTGTTYYFYIELGS